MTTLEDFYGDDSAHNTPECSFCGGKGELIVSVSDVYGPTHWHHEKCKIQDDAAKGTPITPTWDEAMDAAQMNDRIESTFSQWLIDIEKDKVLGELDLVKFLE